MTNKQQITEVVEACFSKNVDYTITDEGDVSSLNEKLCKKDLIDSLTKLLEEPNDCVCNGTRLCSYHYSCGYQKGWKGFIDKPHNSTQKLLEERDERLIAVERERILAHKRNVVNIINPNNIYEAVSVGWIKNNDTIAHYELAEDEALIKNTN